jgi:hypothetical protein
MTHRLPCNASRRLFLRQAGALSALAARPHRWH